MSRLGLLLLQESVSDEQSEGASRAATILCFMREQMEVSDEARVRRRSLKERLGLKGMGCCGTTWGFRSAPVGADEDDDAGNVPPPLERRENDDDDDDDVDDDDNVDNETQRPQDPPPPPAGQDPDCSDPDPVQPAPGMNLAAALAAERQLRATGEETAPATPRRVSLMRLLEETTECGDEVGEGAGAKGNDTVCCVCMGRKKGAAFIPCGHTFCRVCSRELWLNRGTCPLCNRPIIEILDIF